MTGKTYTCIDLGSSSIKLLLVKEVDNRFVTISTHKFESSGIKSGVITNILEVTEKLEDAIEKVERMTNEKIDEVFVGMGGLTVQAVECSGIISISTPDEIVTGEEVERVLEAAKLTETLSDLEVVHVTPVEFALDQMKRINDPLEMKGNRLAMKGMLGLANQTAIHSMRRVVENAGLRLKSLLLNPFAILEHLSKEDRLNGAWLIDIGGETITITVVENEKIQNITVLPIGSDLVTQDLCYMYQLKEDKAKALKHEVGLLNEEGSVRLQTKIGTASADRKEVQRVISARMEEILETILESIQESKVVIPSDKVIFTGGGASMEGFLNLAEEFFGTRTSVLSPNDHNGNVASDFTAISGLIPLYFKNYGDLKELEMPKVEVKRQKDKPKEKVKEKQKDKPKVKRVKEKESSKENKKDKIGFNKMISLFFE